MEAKNPPTMYIDPDSPVFNEATRQHIIDWTVMICEDLNIQQEALHLAVRYLDIFLRKRPAHEFLKEHDAYECSLSKRTSTNGKLILRAAEVNGHGESGTTFPNKMKRLMCTCLFVASKIDARRATTSSRDWVNNFLNVIRRWAFTKPNLVSAERFLLRELRFNLHYSTSASFVSAYFVACDARITCSIVDKETACGVANYLVDLALLSHEMLEYQPSVIAAAAMYLSTKMYQPLASGEDPILKVSNAELTSVTGTCVKDIRLVARCISELCMDSQRFMQLYVNQKHVHNMDAVLECVPLCI